MKQLVFLLEELSMKEVLQVLLPQLLPPGEQIDFKLIVHEGKRDLETSIVRKLRAWQNTQAWFVILRDQDAADCLALKQKLHDLCASSGRTNYQVRIVCRELESWFLGDLRAISLAFNLPKLAKLTGKQKYRAPDRLGNAADELKNLVGTYQKVGGARAIAPHLDLIQNRSHSFHIFIAGIKRIVDAMS